MQRRAAISSWAAAIAGLTLYAGVAQSQERDANAYISKAPIAGVPTGSYSQWTEDQKKNSFRRVVGFCEFLCVEPAAKAYPNQATADRATSEAKTCLGACVVNHLPPDFPELPALKAQLRSDYQKAKQLGSTIAWPLPGR